MSKHSLLDEPADISAEIGSRPWARGVANRIRFQAEKFDSDVASLQRWIEIAAEHEAWRPLGYISLDALLIKEAGISQGVIDAIRQAKGGTVGDAIKAAKEWPIPKHGGDRKSGQDQGDNVTLKASRGNETEYTLRRLARDAPAMLDKIESGELSVNAAAIAAGIRKKPSQAEIAVKAFKRAENRLEAMRLMIDTLEPFEAAIVRDWAMERLS